jgi:hypothetical protein
MECKHDYWGKRITNGTDFPRSGSSKADDEHDFQIWLNHFVNTKYSGRSLDSSLSETNDYNCYHPANYQSRALTSEKRKPHAIDFRHGKPVFEPNVADAIQTYWDHNWVAISEFYSESKCLLLYRMSKGDTRTLTDTMTQEYIDSKCTCRNENKVTSSSKKIEDVKVLHHRGRRRSTLNDLPPDMLAKIEALTRVDSEVYIVALLQFLQEIAWLESESELGRRVLCQPTLDKFEAELSYLGISITEEYNNAVKHISGSNYNNAVKGISGSDKNNAVKHLSGWEDNNAVKRITGSEYNNVDIRTLGPFESLDRIYYINLDKRTDKRDIMESWLEPFSKQYSIPYLRISALTWDSACTKVVGGEEDLKKCRARTGLRNSNFHIMDHLNTTGYTLVLEDDFYITNYTNLLNGVNKVPGDWDAIRFKCRSGKGFLNPREEFPQFEGGYRTVTPRGEKGFCGGTHAVLWRSDRLQNLRKIWEHPNNTYVGIDCALASDELNSYCLQAKIGKKKHGFESDIPKGKLTITRD